MFRFHVQGLSIAVLGKDGLNVLMLNSGHPRKVADVPYHLQTLVTTTNSFSEKDTTMPQLSSIVGRWAPNPSVTPSGEFVGFSLTGLLSTVGASGPVDLAPSLLAGMEHPVVPESGTVDWSDPNWILNSHKMLPTGRLRKQFRSLGQDTHAIVEFHGGRVEGGQPFAEGASQFTWHVHANYEQAFTDTVDVVFPGAPPDVVALDCKGRPAGTIKFVDGGEAWLVNEAPSLAQINMATDAPCGDLLIFLEAFDTETLKEKAAIDFKAANRFGISVPSGTSCDAILCDERSHS